jgi:hypothetical protein
MRLGACAMMCLVACGAQAPAAGVVQGGGGSGGVSAGKGGAQGSSAAAGKAGAASSAGGGGGAGGTNGEHTMLSLKQPIARDGKMVLEFGETYLELAPEHGARITSLRRAGRELLTLTGAENFAEAFGSTFWPSPQRWEWPPPAELDTMPYEASVSGNTISAVSQPHEATSLRVTKRLSADLARDAIDLVYEMTNVGPEPVQWAPWEITRVPAEGLAFWPTGGDPFGEQPMASRAAAGHTWCDPAETEGEGKLFADGAGGYLAYVVGRQLLLKRFTDQPASAMAPGEAEIELYVNPSHDYVEVENQGAYASIQPGSSVAYQVTWYVRELPPAVSVAVGSTDLVAFVAQTLQ